MIEVFLSVLNRSVAAGWLVLAVVVLRLLLRKAPKWVNGLLWGMVAVRLLSPFTLKSVLSLIPSKSIVTPEILAGASSAVDSGVPAVNGMTGPVVPPETGANLLQIGLPILTAVWIVGIIALLVYSVVSYLRLWQKVREATVYRDRIFQSEQVTSAFVLGFRKPRIYLPYGMGEQDMHHVIAHEQTHIRRKDHWWKPLGFLLLAVHWFHPLMWLGYILFCRDIELACDETVIRKLDRGERADYSLALLHCSIDRRSISACPLAFGETGVKKRIQSVLRYKKPGIILIAIALIGCILAAVFFMTDPINRDDIGISDIRVAGSLTADAVLELDYFMMSKSGFSSKLVTVEEGEYVGDGLVEYDGSLGKYRLMITFGDMDLARGIAERYPMGLGEEVITFENVPEDFKGYLKFTVKSPSDHGIVLYIGSDKPFSYQEPSLTGIQYWGGTLKFKLYNYELPESAPAENRPEPGVYRPVACIYQNPYAADETAAKLGDSVFRVGVSDFAVQSAAGTVLETDPDPAFQWYGDVFALTLFRFAEETEFFREMKDSELYNCQINEKYALAKSVTENGERFFLFYYGPGGLYAVYEVVPGG